MNTYKELIIKADILLIESEVYAEKPTKASSARLRKLINEIQKLAVQAKRDLIKADKG